MAVSRNSQFLIFIMGIFIVWTALSQRTGHMKRLLFGRESWQEMAAQKRNDNMQKIPNEWLLLQATLDDANQRRQITGDFIEGLLDAESRRITGLDVPELVDEMGTGSLTAVQVVTAF
jgi:amidase